MLTNSDLTVTHRISRRRKSVNCPSVNFFGSHDRYAETARTFRQVACRKVWWFRLNKASKYALSDALGSWADFKRKFCSLLESQVSLLLHTRWQCNQLPMNNRLMDWLTDWLLTEWSKDALTDWPVDRHTEWMTDLCRNYTEVLLNSFLGLFFIQWAIDLGECYVLSTLSVKGSWNQRRQGGGQ